MEGWAMPSVVKLREDYSAEELWALARRSKDINQIADTMNDHDELRHDP
jgi:hypothetical protein